MIERMSREDFQRLMELKDEDAAMEYADELNYNGESWFEIARDFIHDTRMMLERMQEDEARRSRLKSYWRG